MVQLGPVCTKKNSEEKGKKMKKIILAVTLTLFATSAFAGIAGSKHDLSSGGTNLIKGAGTAGQGSDQLCIYCHVPHNASVAIPLWNRTATSFNGNNSNLYVTSATLSTEAKASLLNATSISMLCLSCHDGATGAATQASIGDRVARNSSGAAGITMTTNVWVVGGLLDGANALTNDHPVGFSYALSQAEKGATSLVAPASATQVTAAIPLFVNGARTSQVECASCHLTHDNTIPKFLRVTNAGSTLCLTCHVK